MTPLRLQIFDSPPTSPEFSIETDVSTQCFWTALFYAGTLLNQAGLYYVLTAMHTEISTRIQDEHPTEAH